MPFSLRLQLHRLMNSAVHFLSTKRPVQLNIDSKILNATFYEQEEIFGLITNLTINPFLRLSPSFQPRWTYYSASVPYEITLLNFQLVVSDLVAYVVYENERSMEFVNLPFQV